MTNTSTTAQFGANLCSPEIEEAVIRSPAQAATALQEALDLAVNIIMANEPGHSCAVSDVAVALAAVASGDTSEAVMKVIRDTAPVPVGVAPSSAGSITPVCCYCDAALSCACCGREQPADAAARASGCRADFYALWCDECNVHPSQCKRRGGVAQPPLDALIDQIAAMPCTGKTEITLFDQLVQIARGIQRQRKWLALPSTEGK